VTQVFEKSELSSLLIRGFEVQVPGGAPGGAPVATWGFITLADVHQEVAGLLGGLGPGRVRGDAQDVHGPGLDLLDEQHVHAPIVNQQVKSCAGFWHRTAETGRHLSVRSCLA
jgi:hypothetical protein